MPARYSSWVLPSPSRPRSRPSASSQSMVFSLTFQCQTVMLAIRWAASSWCSRVRSASTVARSCGVPCTASARRRPTTSPNRVTEPSSLAVSGRRLRMDSTPTTSPSARRGRTSSCGSGAVAVALVRSSSWPRAESAGSSSATPCGTSSATWVTTTLRSRPTSAGATATAKTAWSSARRPVCGSTLERSMLLLSARRQRSCTAGAIRGQPRCSAVRKSRTTGPAASAPLRPVSTNAANATFPCQPTSQPWVGGGVAVPNSAVPVLA